MIYFVVVVEVVKYSYSNSFDYIKPVSSLK